MANFQIIKQISKQKNISLKSIARFAGVTEQGLHKMIREETMSAKTLEMVARALGVSIICFFDNDVRIDSEEDSNNYGERCIAARNVENVDPKQSAGATNKQSMESDIIQLQRKLLNAQNEIINLLKEKK